MKKKCSAVIGMVFCFVMMATLAWALPGVPNGTVTSGNLVWLQNANCFGKQNWSQAMSSAASLKSGSCGLTDGSAAGQWRLPTKVELVSRQKSQQGFYNVHTNVYWSSSTYGYSTDLVWYVDMLDGFVLYVPKTRDYFVWPVRAVQ